jgi:hypothetical protein
MAKGKTIKEVKEGKVELELAVLKLLKTFEESFEVYVDYVSIKRKRVKNPRKGDQDYPEPMSVRKGPLTNVEIETRLDALDW